MARQLSAESVTNILEHLVSSQIEVEDVRRSSSPEGGLFATCVNERDAIVGGFAVDYQAANCLGGAMAGIPPGAVEDAIEENEVGAAVSSALEEIFNVASQCFVDNASEAVYVDTFVELKGWDPVPKDFDELVGGASVRLGLDLEVPRYGEAALEIWGV